MPPRGAVGGITVISRRELHRQIEETEAIYNDTLRSLIVDQGRVDVLAIEVLNLKIAYHHLQMLKHQFLNKWSLVLIPRGHGKTLVCQIADAIQRILANPDVRLIFGSRANVNARDSLDVVKNHFTKNEKLKALFGEHFNRDHWNKDSITVKTRKGIIREPTIVTISPDSAVSSKHGDVGYGDDFVDESNSRTPVMREHLETFFWKTFIPTLEPDTSELNLLGTRYDPDDLYSHLGAPESVDGDPQNWDGLLVDSTLVLPAIYKGTDGNEYPLWPEKFSLESLDRVRRGRKITFESQYQQNVRPMKSAGHVKYGDIDRFDVRDLPVGLPTFGGFDLAIGMNKENDLFWALCGAYNRETGDVWVYGDVHGRKQFHEQQDIIVSFFFEYDMIRACVEAVGYQQAQVDEIKRKNPLLNVFGDKPQVDKLARFERHAHLFSDGKIHIERSLEDLVSQIVSFTGQKGRPDDGVDAFILMMKAITAGGRKKKERKEPKLY